MPAVTVDELVEAVASRGGRLLLLVGRYLDGAGGTARTIRDGLRLGLQAVGRATAAPLALADPDVAPLDGFAAARVLDVAELYALRAVLLHWSQAMRTEGVGPVEKSEDTRGGTLWADQQAVRDRVAALERIVAEPYLGPLAGTVAVVAGDDRRRDWRPCPAPYPFDI